MIKYKLTCKECNIFFDSWFASSNEFEKLKKKKLLNCHNCNSQKIEKTLMAPKLMNRSYLKSSEEKNVKLREVKNKIREYQKFIKENFDYVGDNFAYEARSIHYNQKKKNKGIYGTASKKEITELKEEGVEAELIPWVEDKSN
jgi:hypothetical protein|tara:strand:+ start:733 stop:1161 length:429 start_codon:yes stop_codon:yes gene_type:complete